MSDHDKSKQQETRENLPHKGEVKSAPNPQTGSTTPATAPDGNGATGKPAAFPPHN